MREIKLKTGILLIPKDWIIVENIPLAEADAAGVVETRNGNGEVPHFVYLGRKKEDIYQLSQEERDEILTLSAEASAVFDKVLSEYLLLPKDDNGIIRDAEIHRTAKEPGLFTIFDKGEYDLKDWSYPFGAMIVRNEDSGEE